MTFSHRPDFVANSYQVQPSVDLRDSEMVFVGYGVAAPERQWDDFKGVDLRNKVAVFLVNDPDFEAAQGDPSAGKFGGKAMTYYGRWTYKFEEAARRGAIAAIIVHETEARVPSGTAVKPGRFAAAVSAARSLPEAANRRCAASWVSQPTIFDWSMGPLGSSILYWAPVQEDWTTFQP